MGATQYVEKSHLIRDKFPERNKKIINIKKS